MKLQGISNEGLKRIARKVGQAEGDRIIDGITFRWDDESNPADPGWVWLDTYSDPQAVPGNEGRDPNASDEELFTAAFGRAPEGISASKRPRRAQEKGTGGNEYWNTVKAIAQDVKDRYDEAVDSMEVTEMVWQEVDGNEYIIYYHKNLVVLQNSDNSDPIDDAGIDIDTSRGWQHILTQVAFHAMEADVWDALRNLGWDGESFGNSDDEEDF